MARTPNGNLTGKAAHGIDDIYEMQSDYSKRLDIAKAKVKSIFSDDAFFIHWMMRIEQGKMLETMENVIVQVTHYDNGVDLVDVENWQIEAKALAADAGEKTDFNLIAADLSAQKWLNDNVDFEELYKTTTARSNALKARISERMKKAYSPCTLHNTGGTRNK